METSPDSADVRDMEAALRAGKNEHRALRVAVVALKVVAAFELVAGIYWAFHTFNQETDALLRSWTPGEGVAPQPSAVGLVLQIAAVVVASFFIFVAGDVLKLLLEAKADLAKLVSRVTP